MRPAINAAARTIQRRPFSLAQSLRAMGRAIEVHPIQRMQQRSWHAPADWGKQMRRLTTQVAIFIPGIGMLLGWPLIAKRVLNGHVV